MVDIKTMSRVCILQVPTWYILKCTYILQDIQYAFCNILCNTYLKFRYIHY